MLHVHLHMFTCFAHHGKLIDQDALCSNDHWAAYLQAECSDDADSTALPGKPAADPRPGQCMIAVPFRLLKWDWYNDEIAADDVWLHNLFLYAPKPVADTFTSLIAWEPKSKSRMWMTNVIVSGGAKGDESRNLWCLSARQALLGVGALSAGLTLRASLQVLPMCANTFTAIAARSTVPPG